PRGLSRRVDSDRPPRRCPGFDPPLAKARSASATNNQISVVIKPWAPHHFRGLFSSITPHAAAAVIPPSAMSTKTSFGVPIGVILPTRTNRSVVISSLHDHDRGQAEGVRATVELDLRLATRSGLFDHPPNAVLVHAEHCLDDGHRGHHHEVADSVDAVKLGHFCLVWIKVSMKQALISVHVVRTLLDKNRKITNRYSSKASIRSIRRRSGSQGSSLGLEQGLGD